MGNFLNKKSGIDHTFDLSHVDLHWKKKNFGKFLKPENIDFGKDSGNLRNFGNYELELSFL